MGWKEAQHPTLTPTAPAAPPRLRGQVPTWNGPGPHQALCWCTTPCHLPTGQELLCIPQNPKQPALSSRPVPVPALAPAALRPSPASPGLPRAARSQRNRSALSYSALHSPSTPSLHEHLAHARNPEAQRKPLCLPGRLHIPGTLPSTQQLFNTPALQACTAWHETRRAHSQEVSPMAQGEEAAGTEGYPLLGNIPEEGSARPRPGPLGTVSPPPSGAGAQGK